jgi:nitrite reductase (NADH) small subunit
MARWIRLCGTADVPAYGEAKEIEVMGVGICLANIDGTLSAMENTCPHSGGPLGQGLVQGDHVVCPWHGWSFNVKTGVAEDSGGERVQVFPVKIEVADVMIDTA